MPDTLEKLEEIRQGFYKNKADTLAHIRPYYGGFQAEYSSSKRPQTLTNKILSEQGFSSVFIEDYIPSPKEQQFIRKIQEKQAKKRNSGHTVNFSITAPHVWR